MHSAVAVAIAILKPYKKTYMNLLDTLILLNSAAISHLVTSSGYKMCQANIFMLSVYYQVVCFGFVLFSNH